MKRGQSHRKAAHGNRPEQGEIIRERKRRS